MCHDEGHTYRNLMCYIRSELMNWKDLEAYNYFQSGHIHLIKVYKAQSSM